MGENGWVGLCCPSPKRGRHPRVVKLSHRDAKSASKSIETDRSLGSATAEATEENSFETKEDGEWGSARLGLSAEGASTSRDEVEMLKLRVDERGRL